MSTLLPEQVAPSLASLVRLGALAGRQAPARARDTAVPGLRTGQRRGRGLEFEELRDYRPGDDPRSIDWRATARTGRTHTRLYRDERDVARILIVDLRGAMAFATRGALRSAVAARLAALLAWQASLRGDRLRLLVCTGGAVVPLAGLRRRGTLRRALALLAGAAAGAVRDAAAAANCLDEAMRLAAVATHPGSEAVVISDAAGLAAASDSALLGLRRLAAVEVVLVQDAVEQALPAGRDLALWTAAGRRVLDGSNPRDRQQWQQAVASRLPQQQQRLRRLGIGSRVAATTDDDAALARLVRTGPGATR